VKTLICVVAYEAADHIESTLSKLPKEVWSSPDFHVLVSDDHSADDTVALAKACLSKLGKNYTVISTRQNQGYGGNQKICYRFALERGFDSVILLHGDGQYAPELVGKYRDVLKAGADVALGSRMMIRGDALSGGMPVYKYFGNRILTRVQNGLLGTQLTEFHSGFRGYSAEFLKKIPFDINADGFHFDTEILIQAFHVDAKIEEFSIPTYYGNEVCRVPGIRYSLKVLATTLQYRFQIYGLSTSLKYPRSANKVYKSHLDNPHSVHSMVFSRLLDTPLPSNDRRILDIGSGPGHLAKRLSSESFDVTTVDKYEPTESSEENHILVDLDNEPWIIDISRYETVLLLDVIEHLNDPEQFMLALRRRMNTTSRPTIYISVPNISFVLVRIALLFGRFSYADRGILDITHKRFFTPSSLRRLLLDTGYEIKETIAIGVPLLAFHQNGIFSMLSSLSKFVARIWTSMFAFQILLVAEPKSSDFDVLADSDGK
jgi:glycosyltransferase involved in cell wall biosynthesis